MDCYEEFIYTHTFLYLNIYNEQFGWFNQLKLKDLANIKFSSYNYDQMD